MSLYASGKYLMKNYDQPIYVGDKRVKAIFVGKSLVYPEDFQEGDFYLKRSMWVNLDDEVCSSFGDKVIDQAGLAVYTKDSVEITECAALIFPNFSYGEDGRGNSGSCDVVAIIIECENPKSARVGAFGMYRGNVVYDYKSDAGHNLIRFDIEKNGMASTTLFGYRAFLDNGKAISFASGVESNGIKIAYPGKIKKDS